MTWALMLRRAGQYGAGEIGTAVEEEELPPEAHHTLFMSGMPLDIQKREATHIFRPLRATRSAPAPSPPTSKLQGCALLLVVPYALSRCYKMPQHSPL